MLALSSVLLQREIVALHDLDSAVQRQLVHGGDLVTNLLEVTALDETQLLQALSDAEGLPTAPCGALPQPDDASISAVPADLAERFSCVPLTSTDQAVTVAVCEPLAPAVLAQLEAYAGRAVEQRITTAPRLRQAIAALLDRNLDRRSVRAIARLEGLADPSPGAVEVDDEDDLPWATATTQGAAFRPSTAPPSSRSNVMYVPRRKLVAPQRKAPQRRGPFTLAMAQEALEEADTHGAALRVLFDFARQFFEYAALFIVRGELAEGADASGAGATRAQIRGVGVPLEIDSVLSAARDRGACVLAVPASHGLDLILRRDLQRPMQAAVLVLPVVVRNRCIALVYGDDGTNDVDLDVVGEALALAPLVSAAIERIIMLRKLAIRRGSDVPPGSARGRTLRGLSGLQQAAAARTPTASPQQPAALPAPPRMPLVMPAPPQAERADVTATWHQPAELAARADSKPAVGVSAEAVSVRQPAVTRADAPGQSRAAHTVSSMPSLEQPPAEKHVQESEQPHVAQEAAAVEGPVAVVSQDEPDEMTQAVLAELENSPELADGAPDSSIALGPQALPKRGTPSDMGLPSIMIDLKSELAPLFARLNEGSLDRDELATVRSALLATPDTAVSLVQDVFPGQVTEELDPSYSAARPASSCGAVLALAVDLGLKIVPVLETMVKGSELTKRLWALQALAEIGGAAARESVGRALMNDDARVRSAAQSCMRLYAGKRAWVSSVRATVASMAGDEQTPAAERAAAFEALGELIEASFMPVLINALDASSEQLRAAAHEALVRLARRSLPPQKQAWQAWWEEHRSRDRFEWLIEAIGIEDEVLSAAAVEELHEACGEDFGYKVNQPREERLQVQESFELWWEDEGCRRVTEPPGAG